MLMRQWIRPGTTKNVVRCVSALAGGIMLVGIAQADQGTSAGWTRISDASGSSLEVPTALLKRERDPVSLTFVGKDAAQIMFETVTESRPGFPGNDPESDMALERANCTAWPPSYHVVKATLAAYSCAKAGNVIYYLARYSRSGSIVLRATYPKSHAAVWDKVVDRMSASMRQVTRNEVTPR